MERFKAVENLVEFLIGEELNDVYGVESSICRDSKNRPYANIIFCKAFVTDGSIAVYSDKYIIVKWHTQRRDLPFKGSQLFRDLIEAKQFISDFFGSKHVEV
jgi:hypothetical protein